MILADYHVHSEFSSDSTAALPAIIEAAIDRQFHTICLTDHMDIDFPVADDGMDFQLDTPLYIKELTKLQELYQEKINIKIGVELGLMKHIAPEIASYVSQYDFDFIIGSSHLTNDKMDPFYPAFYEGRTAVAAYRQYFESTLENVQNIKHYNVYGHLDYAVRYCPDKNFVFDFHDYADILEAILKIIIQDGKGIEINTAGLAKGLGYAHPHKDILTMYKALGGEIITIGSDAHSPEYVGYDFAFAEELLKEVGFRYYTIFSKQKPEFIKLS